ncbi:hypothetical protein I7I50_07800 [Histoplasma capsulatum G186AR]|uniref:Uncharacterized protein n=1 Tax=Ajellomyces capsulatus TaxID=5037 RepID=A0A8H8D273_AJECA|nr:hypothetical protein I7I52_09127 [Histoplasma capsulatum]QSS68399.1 hypothetical protein I7I50_07800 [Histoplasma capsulatum G186AR]
MKVNNPVREANERHIPPSFQQKQINTFSASNPTKRETRKEKPGSKLGDEPGNRGGCGVGGDGRNFNHIPDKKINIFVVENQMEKN